MKNYRIVFKLGGLLVLKRVHKPGYEVWVDKGDDNRPLPRYYWAATYDTKFDAIESVKDAAKQNTEVD
jgi:hypothetical protein